MSFSTSASLGTRLMISVGYPDYRLSMVHHKPTVDKSHKNSKWREQSNRLAMLMGTTDKGKAPTQFIYYARFLAALLSTCPLTLPNDSIALSICVGTAEFFQKCSNDYNIIIVRKSKKSCVFQYFMRHRTIFSTGDM